MSSAATPPAPRGAPAPRGPAPHPPGGHPLRIDPQATPPRRATALPVVDETSAGGLVVTQEDGVFLAAVIARRNRAGRLEWCLPKGHLEGAETPEEAAVREIAEETGIDGRILRRLGVIDYWFSGDDRRVHKVVHHFLLGAVGGELSVEGDPDGEAEDAAWVPVAALPDRLAYPNERRLAHTALTLLVDAP
ncbi:NUDIX hydrolase [Cellulomonas endophytica]|uniref:NUDIX hydrolase n=1 Tax=Cellulomonas endophytica TaxID=2494735 RepID=UPI001012C0ED|nr:NUDIX hydrolase [Cellulomonas endophytica]